MSRAATDVAKKDTPCISICRFDGRTGWCQGCGCTLVEIKGWKKMPPYRRTALQSELGRRVPQLSNGSVPIRKVVVRRSKDTR